MGSKVLENKRILNFIHRKAWSCDNVVQPEASILGLVTSTNGPVREATSSLWVHIDKGVGETLRCIMLPKRLSLLIRGTYQEHS